jgi:hypothetical protein
MSHHLLDDLAALFRDVATPKPFVVLAVSNSMQNGGDERELLLDKITALQSQFGGAQVLHMVFSAISRGPEEDKIVQKLLDLMHDETNSSVPRERARNAFDKFVQKHVKEPHCRYMSYQAAKANQGTLRETLFFAGVDHTTPSLSHYLGKAHVAWARCQAEPFVQPVGITRPDLVLAERDGNQNGIRWTAVVWRTLLNAGKLVSNSISENIQLFFFRADVYTATLAAIDTLKASAMAPPLSEQKIEAKTPEYVLEIVDLDQIAAIIHLKKSSMGAYKRRQTDPLPDPDFPGGGGKRDHWSWNTIRPWLVRNFALPIPDHYPDISRRY